MTSRQRMLTAMRNETPDRVLVAPDISMGCQMVWEGTMTRTASLL